MTLQVQEQTLTPQELEQAHLFLQQTSNNAMVSAIKGMSDRQWHFSPKPEHWSIAQIVDHSSSFPKWLECCAG